MRKYVGAALVLIILFGGLICASASALSIYIIHFTMVYHDRNIVRSFNAILYDDKDQYEVTMYLHPPVLDAIESGCGTRTFTFPSSYSCKNEDVSVEMRSSSSIKVTFVDVLVDTGISAEFNFSAEDICNEDVSRDGLCLDISGKGSVSDKTITGSGIFRTHTVKTIYNVNGQTLSRGLWTSIETISFSDNEVNFKASTSTGIVYVKLLEGKSGDGQVCAYGPQLGIQKAEDAICVSADVRIDSHQT
jgi:hypothetical protein